MDQVFSRTPASGTVSYVLADPLGSTVGLADTSGVVQTSYVNVKHHPEHDTKSCPRQESNLRTRFRNLIRALDSVADQS